MNMKIEDMEEWYSILSNRNITRAINRLDPIHIRRLSNYKKVYLPPFFECLLWTGQIMSDSPLYPPIRVYIIEGKRNFWPFLIGDALI
ncbi:hypothetical protein BDB01DRAFT_773744 [Pilobolus umbonatus]|nr:hypothetical protein BDB01DRAFT_773744 [Pilobolus umbonatus]